MRMYKSCFSFIAFLFVFVSLSAQTPGNTRANKDSLLNKITDIDSRLKELSIKDSTMGFSAPLIIDTAYLNRIHLENMHPLRDEKGLLLFSHEWTPFDPNITFRDTVIFDPAFLPVVFNGKILSDDIDLRKQDTINQAQVFHLISPDSTFVPSLKKTEHVKNMRKLYYTINPMKIRLNALDFQNTPVLKEDIVEKKNPFKELLAADNPIDATKPDIEKIGIKPVYWIKNGSHKLDLTQNSFSDHWPGENNINVYSEHRINLNYKKKKVYFNNMFEWKLSLQQMKADTVNKVNILDDLFRTYSTFGVNAFKNWSYNTNLEIKTPLFNRYNVNDPKETRKRQRAFLSPLEVNLGVGMRYSKEITSKADKYRKFNITLDLSLLSLNYKYVGSNEVEVTMFGIEKDHRAKTDYGSTYTLNMAYSRNRYTNFSSRFKYFTNYERVYMEWENSLNFKLNNYFSTSFYLYVKYDDNVYRDQQKDRWARYFSYYQRLGFGLYYNW